MVLLILERGTLLFQCFCRIWQSWPSVVVFLIGVFHLVMSLQGARGVAGVTTVATAEGLQEETKITPDSAFKIDWGRPGRRLSTCPTSDGEKDGCQAYGSGSEPANTGIKNLAQCVLKMTSKFNED